MKQAGSLVGLAFRAVAMAMAALSIAFVALRAGTLELYALFLSIGLFSLALSQFMPRKESD